MAVTKSGRMAGSVSGGCIEGAVAEAAMKTLETGTPQLLDFGVTHERAWEVGLACGGKVKVFVEKLRDTGEILAALAAAREQKRPVVVATELPRRRSSVCCPIPRAPDPV